MSSFPYPRGDLNHSSPGRQRQPPVAIILGKSYNHASRPFRLLEPGENCMPKVASNQVNLYYEVSGAGQPLVFIHGLGSSTRDWEFQVSEFSKSYQVITIDLRGHGRSDKPAGPYQMSMFAADLAGLLRALGVGSAHIVGISLGGAVAFQFAIDYPARVKTLVIANSAPALGGTPEQAAQEVGRRVGIVQQHGMRAMGQALGPSLFPKPEHAGRRETFVERWAENDPQAYIEATRSMLGWDVTAQLGSIMCPTLIIAADQDYSPVALKEAYIKLMPNAQLVVIPDAHHATPMEEPQKFNAALARFLAEHN
jgi:3-oxoadipate enol-lactonase